MGVSYANDQGVEMQYRVTREGSVNLFKDHENSLKETEKFPSDPLGELLTLGHITYPHVERE